MPRPVTNHSRPGARPNQVYEFHNQAGGSGKPDEPRLKGPWYADVLRHHRYMQKAAACPMLDCEWGCRLSNPLLIDDVSLANNRPLAPLQRTFEERDQRKS